MKFRFRIAVAMVCLLSLLFGAGGAAMIADSFQKAVERESRTIRETSEMLLETLRTVNGIESWADEQEMTDALRRLAPAHTFPLMRLSAGDSLLYSRGEADARFRDLREPAQDGKMALGYFRDDGGTLYVQTTAAVALGNSPMFLDLGKSLSDICETCRQEQRTYRRIFLALLLLCALLSYMTAAFLTRPLGRLSATAKEIASGNLSCRSHISSKDEIGALAAEFDAMARQVEESVRTLKEEAVRREQFMGSFAHELKTPMTSIIGYADLLRGGALTGEESRDAADYIFKEGRRLENLSLKLLDLFVMDQKEWTFVKTAPAALVSDIVRHQEEACRKAGISLAAEGEEGVCLLEPDLTRTLVWNLLDNAKKAMEDGGSIRIRTQMLPDGCRICVADTGKGIPGEAVAHLTEAFYQVEKSRSGRGAGLGLALCEKITALHRGSLAFESVPGVGTTVRAELRGGRP